jgi:hypothetical protein
MKNLFIQREFGYCTVYALANMFRDNFFLQHYAQDENFKGCDDDKEKIMIQAYDKSISWSEITSVRHSYKIPIPPSLVSGIFSHQDPEGDNYTEFDIIPYLCAVRLIDTHEFHHSVCVLNVNKEIYYIDPKREDIIKLDKPTDIYNYIIDIWTIKRPYLVDTDKFVRLSSSALGFKFNPVLCKPTE